MSVQKQKHVLLHTSDWIVCVIQLWGFSSIQSSVAVYMEVEDLDVEQICQALDWDSLELNKDNHLHPFGLDCNQQQVKSDSHYQWIRALGQSRIEAVRDG